MILPPGLHTLKVHDPEPLFDVIAQWCHDRNRYDWYVNVTEDGCPVLCRVLDDVAMAMLRDANLLPVQLPPRRQEIDIDALLAGAETVREPSADRLLWQFAWDGYENLHDIPEGAFDAWHRHLKWRVGPGRRIVCRDCDTVFVRDRKNGQRCTNCRVTYRRTCVGCGEAFAALHHAFKRCPPCREVWLRR